MDDALAPSEDVFAQLDPDQAASSAAAPAPPAPPAPADPAEPAAKLPQDNEPNPFTELGEVGPGESTAFGAFRRGAGRGAVPAATGLVAMGAGAELGAIVGTAAGPGWGNLAGGFVGGIAGGIAGGMLGSAAQNWMLSKLPDSWVDALGQSERQQKLDEAQHATASFLGGMTPYVVAMRPGAVPLAALPENATTLQRIMSNKATAAAFGGAVNGGMEIGQEAIHGDVNWQHVAIATAFGTVFNQPTRFGQRITELGAYPVRSRFGVPHPTPPTIAEAGDLKVMGPGVTEEVFHGTQEQAPSAALTAQEAARAERAALAEPPEPDLQSIARRMEPELFAEYERLVDQRDAFRKWIEESNKPSPETLAELQAEKDGLQQQLDQHVASRGGYEAGPEARKLRAQIREVQKEHDILVERASRFSEGKAEETADLAIARKHLLDTDFQLRDIQTQIGAAYRRAADTTGTGIIEPEQFPSFAAMLAAHEHGGGNVPSKAVPAVQAEPALGAGENVPGVPGVQPAGENVQTVSGTGVLGPQRSIGEQKAFIANDVAEKLIAAGRPEEEARAAGQLVAARYATRAGRFEGKLGTAEELYAREGAAIAGEGRKALEPASAKFRAAMADHVAGKIDAQKYAAERAEMYRARDEIEAKERADHISVMGREAGLPVAEWMKAPGAPTLPSSASKTAASAWDDLIAQRLDTRDVLKPSGGFNTDKNRQGTPLRSKASQVWEPGNMVNVGFLKDLLIARRNDDGSFQLLSKPDQNGMSRTYEFKPQEGITGDAKRVDFLEQAKDVIEARELAQTARGKIRIAPGRRPIITLMKEANASTFIHESGHQYLEELMRDGMHADAPMGLRDDMQTVRDWLGVKDDIKTKHHEKFARGFEQYVREGVAPSPELAGVFAKFRNWLLSIYQSIRGLGAEISPEIRAVFDRMLEMEPQRTIIAPERQSPTLLHDIHEAEARTVEPHEAEAAMDRIVAERDRYIEEQPPEIQREIETATVKIQEAEAAAAGAAPGGEAGGGAVGVGPLVEDRGGPGAEPEGGARGAEHGAVKPGGGGAGAEGAKPLAADRRAGLGDHASTALAPSPADLFGARESPFTDRAGNIRVENLTKNEDVAQAIRDAAEENQDFIGDRRGVITDGQVMELADALGMDVRKLNERHIGQAFNAEQIVAARKLLIQSATDVAAAMKKAATGTDEDVLAYATAKDRHQMIQAQVSGITAEAGRALRAFRSLAGQEEAKGIDQFIREATGKTLFQLRQEAQLGLSLETPQQVSKFMMDAQKRSFGRMILEFWINSILSGPATHATNIIGNSLLAAQHFGPETAIAALLGRAQAALGREGTRVRLGEIGAAVGGARRGLAPAIGATGEAFAKGASTLLPGETPRLMEFQPHDMLAARGTLDEAMKYSDVVQNSFSAFRGVRDAVMSVGTLLKGGVEGSPLFSPQYSHLGAIPDIQFRGVTVAPVGTIARLPGRFLATADTFFRSLNYAMAKNALAYRQAAHEGLTGTEFDARVAELRDNPSPEMMEEARGAATSTTLMDKGGQFVQAMNHLTSASVDLPLIGEITPLKFINPFVNIAGQIINQSIIKRSPVGLLSRELRADLSGKNGNIAQDMAQARMLMGTAVAMAMGGLAAEGLASGSGPKDHDENAMWKMAGNQPHSVKIGNMWYAVNKLGPLGMLMGMAADLYDVAHKAQEGEYTKAAAHFHHAITQNILDQSFMKGPADLIQAIEDPDRYGGRYVRNFLASFTPNVSAQIARAQDPYSRETRTVIDAIKAKVPGLSQTLMPKRDIWGEPMPNQEALGGKGVTGIYVKKMSEDPVNQAMVKLGVHPGAVDKKIRNIELTPQQYDDYARIAGRTTKMRLDTIVRAPDYQTWPDHIKHDVIAETIKQSREAARGLVMMKYPDLVAQATEQLRKKARGEKVNGKIGMK